MLTENVEYSLRTQDAQHTEQKTRILLKLTDSALRAIEEYVSIKAKTSRQPTVQFQNNIGSFSFPASNGGSQSFSFAVSNSTETESSFECLQQHGSRNVEAIGGLQYKGHIQAKDDVYDQTRNKMAQEKVESLKNCTKVIKENTGKFIGKKVKVTKPSGLIPGSLLSATSAPLSSKVSSLSPSPCSIPKQPSNHSSSFLNASSRLSPSGRSSAASTFLSGSTSSSSATNQKLVNGPNPSKSTNSNSDVMKRPLRERVIHLLAVRPFKKPELIVKLNQDGLKQSDKPILMPLLQQVATMKDNVYTLNKFCWKEVQEDWPFYSEQDKQLLKRRKPQNLTPPSGDEAPSSSCSPSAQKRVMEDSPISMQSKKQRISHYSSKPDAPLNDPPRRETPSPFDEPVPHHAPSQPPAPLIQHNSYFTPSSLLTDASQPKPPAKPPSPPTYQGQYNQSKYEVPEKNIITNGKSYAEQVTKVSPTSTTPNLLPNGSQQPSVPSYASLPKREFGGVSSSVKSVSPQTTTVSPPVNSNVLMTGAGVMSAVSPDSINEDYGSNDYNDCITSSTSDTLDFQRKYGPIRTVKQRRQYKHDFGVDYQEYRKLHEVITKVASRFAHLEKTLNANEKDSDQWIKIRNDIIEAYKETRRDKYQDAKRRLKHLHEKLAYIKQLVIAFDKMVLAGELEPADLAHSMLTTAVH